MHDTAIRQGMYNTQAVERSAVVYTTSEAQVGHDVFVDIGYTKEIAILKGSRNDGACCIK